MIHSLAVVDPKAKIGENVEIGPFSTIYGDVEIGDGTQIGPNVTIFDGARIGQNCKIFPGAVISANPQDLKYKGEETCTYIGNNTTIRECVTINKGTSESMETRIGDNCLIMAYCHIAHDCQVGDFSIFSNNTTLAGHVIIGKHVILSGMTAFHQFTHVGDYAFIAGGTMVRKDIPPFIKVAREPASFIGLNSIGLERRGFSSEKIEELQNIYRILYGQNKNNTQAVEAILEEIKPSPERDAVVNFVKNSERGIVKGLK
ncbi:MAG: acyl-[acyl-carrier-protein]--UDP-N-acetylglucosamine O-acyltransferase [Flavobacteriaceae bacterium]|nr:MAG: acyl-[acyl-carrier-protein]--UDP-N-acetylglucosamine O-acyltransferase [Flavobacteriaceae bacterium]